MAIPHSIIDMMERAQKSGAEPAFTLPSLASEDRRRSRDMLKQLHPVAVTYRAPERETKPTTTTPFQVT
jgi:hypothetical protein